MIYPDKYFLLPLKYCFDYILFVACVLYKTQLIWLLEYEWHNIDSYIGILYILGVVPLCESTITCQHIWHYFTMALMGTLPWYLKPAWCIWCHYVCSMLAPCNSRYTWRQVSCHYFNGTMWMLVCMVMWVISHWVTHSPTLGTIQAHHLLFM